jgi:hypothetical protein
LKFDEDRVDPYDRALAYVWVPDLDGELFNETLVRRGLARVLTVEANVKYEDRFRAAERRAKAEGIGVWAADPCSTPEATAPQATVPEATAPEATTPEPTSLEPTTPEPTTPEPTPPRPIPEPTTPAPPPPPDGTVLDSGGPENGPADARRRVPGRVPARAGRPLLPIECLRQPRSGAPGLQEGEQMPWWRRMFGGRIER